MAGEIWSGGFGPAGGAWRCPYSRVKVILGFYECVAPRDRVHVTQKPLPLMRELLRIVPPGATVLDPFMGSGTTGVACVQTGRRFVGIELDPVHFECACERISNAHRQGALFVHADNANEQARLTLE
ncbi:site-specific DNA-methyltransferase [Paraburkholderia oxyphila]|uniref:site-specific DNA-methyltransferase n=1 Tax=Paraburkholderia oxyphila TaxID=614212 RepID=UPI002ADE8BAA|nr:site-specific DNA-methyltransferase [Paraburkholderia oxyphila]